MLGVSLNIFTLAIRNAWGSGSQFAGASLNLDFTSGNQTLDPRITFTRASNATRINSAGVLELVSTNGPRFDYDAVTLQPKGLLIEEQRTNLLTYSEQFDNAAWVPVNSATVSANAAVSPNGIATADLLAKPPSINAGIVQGATAVPGVTYCFSVYAKQESLQSASFALLNASSATIFVRFIVDLTTGAVTVVNGASSIAVSDAGNGWWRISATCTAIDAQVRALIYAGDYRQTIAGGLYIWGAQLEAGAFATSYIPTTTAAATRAADVAVMTGANFSSWYNQSEGTLFADYQVTAGVNQRAFTVSDGTLSNVMNILVTNSSGNGSSFAVTTAGSLVASVPANLVTQSATAYKVAGAYKADDVNGARNGTVGTTDVSAAIPAVDRAAIGASGAASQFLNGHIRRIAYWPRRLTNAELQGVTA
jgi:hypothetical protein